MVSSGLVDSLSSLIKSLSPVQTLPVNTVTSASLYAKIAYVNMFSQHLPGDAFIVGRQKESAPARVNVPEVHEGCYAL